MDDEIPLDADELMAYFERIDRLPPEDAEWVNRLFQECLRARVHEAELQSGQEACPFEDPSQIAQVALDTAEWLKTLWNVGYMGAGSFPSKPRSAFPEIELEDVLKSALFARIRQGKRPLPFPPPTRNGLPWHDLLEEAEGESHKVAAEIVRNDQGKLVGTIIEKASGWRIIREIEENREYIVQYQGKGPLFRLILGVPDSVLRREPKEWARNILQQERVGIRTFTLLWPEENSREKRVPLRALTWERAESEAAHWVAANHPEMYGQIRFIRQETASG
ncbi:MAG: hypothetical protein LBJ76_06045 [Candidatus Accumulibacter sp.]|jgi:hypothetical protein|nr:hypothetical protein [Accumulibacter sp.]